MEINQDVINDHCCHWCPIICCHESPRTNQNWQYPLQRERRRLRCLKPSPPGIQLAFITVCFEERKTTTWFATVFVKHSRTLLAKPNPPSQIGRPMDEGGALFRSRSAWMVWYTPNRTTKKRITANGTTMAITLTDSAAVGNENNCTPG